MREKLCIFLGRLEIHQRCKRKRQKRNGDIYICVRYENKELLRNYSIDGEYDVYISICTRTKYKQIWKVILIVRCFVSTLKYMMNFERKLRDGIILFYLN